MNKKEKCGAMKIAKFINQNQIRPSNHRPLNIPHIGPRKNAKDQKVQQAQRRPYFSNFNFFSKR